MHDAVVRGGPTLIAVWHSRQFRDSQRPAGGLIDRGSAMAPPYAARASQVRSLGAPASSSAPAGWNERGRESGRRWRRRCGGR